MTLDSLRLLSVSLKSSLALIFPNKITFSEKVSTILIAGGSEYNPRKFLDVINDFPRNIQIPFSGLAASGPSLVKHDNSIIMECFKLENGSLKHHSTLNFGGRRGTSIATNSVTFTFGGDYTDSSYEYLPKNSTTWILGTNIIPGGINEACGIAINSDQEILLIGNRYADLNRKILKFNVKDHTFEELPTKLIHGRAGARCAYLPGNKKIIITGGLNLTMRSKGMSSAEIFDIEDNSITMAPNSMNVGRSYHGIGVLTVDDQDRLAVFGGKNESGDLDSVELLDPKTLQWEISDMKLNGKRADFGFLSVKYEDICKL